MAAQYELLKELLNSGTSLTFGQEVFYIEKEIFVRENSHLKRLKIYVIEISDPEEIQVILQGTKLVTCREPHDSLILENLLVVQDRKSVV